LNFIYSNEIVGELQLKVGDEPPTHQSSTFLETLAKAKTVDEFNEHLLGRLDSLS